MRNQCNALIGYHLAAGSTFDQGGETYLIAKAARHIRTFIDFGANVGAWTNTLLAYQPKARGILIEPAPDALAKLRANVPDTMTVVPAAASAAVGTMRFYDEGGASTESSAFAGLTTGATAIDVPVVTIDGVLTEHGWDTVDLLKIDAQGNDGHVLEGAAKTLARQGAAIIQFEYAYHWMFGGSTLTATVEMLLEAGYEVWIPRRDGFEPYDHRLFGEFFWYSNFVATTPRGQSWIRG
jgi:FkbM family methyltransferase